MISSISRRAIASYTDSKSDSDFDSDSDVAQVFSHSVSLVKQREREITNICKLDYVTLDSFLHTHTHTHTSFS